MLDRGTCPVILGSPGSFLCRSLCSSAFLECVVVYLHVLAGGEIHADGSVYGVLFPTRGFGDMDVKADGKPVIICTPAGLPTRVPFAHTLMCFIGTHCRHTPPCPQTSHRLRVFPLHTPLCVSLAHTTMPPNLTSSAAGLPTCVPFAHTLMCFIGTHPLAPKRHIICTPVGLSKRVSSATAPCARANLSSSTPLLQRRRHTHSQTGRLPGQVLESLPNQR